MNITIDGNAKTIKDAPVQGQDLHILAGRPSVLKSNGKDVPNNTSTYTVTEGQAFVTH